MPTVAELVPLLQTAIGPVILISGVGLLLLTMTNRLGRVIDRARLLDAQCQTLNDAEREQKMAQLEILWHRARIIRISIALAASSSLFAAILVAVLFVTAWFQIEIAWLIGVLFIICMLLLIVSLLAFIHDVNQSLSALKLELSHTVLKND